MEQNKALSTVEQNALQVKYEICGTAVELDIDFVKKYLVRGRSELVTDQELVMFINTCKMQKLNPLANGEVYLIKYSKDEPAQMVVGKDSYNKRAFLNPNYLGKEDGIVVVRGNTVVQKKGCCLYPTEELIGGWCRVFYIKKSIKLEAFREVSLSEYNKGMANWKSKPATMINKVAIAQCLRDAFPSDYEGLYAEEELISSGLVRADDEGKIQVIDADGVVVEGENTVELPEDNRVITQDERKEMFAFAQEVYGGKEAGNAKIKEFLKAENVESTTELKKAQYDRIMAQIEQDKNGGDKGDDNGDAE